MIGVDNCRCPNCDYKEALFFYNSNETLGSSFECPNCGMTAAMQTRHETSINILNQRRKEGNLPLRKRLFKQKYVNNFKTT